MYKLEAVTQKIEINVSSNVCRFWNIPDLSTLLVFVYTVLLFCIIESVDSMCRDSTNTQYMAIRKISKSQKWKTYKHL